MEIVQNKKRVKTPLRSRWQMLEKLSFPEKIYGIPTEKSMEVQCSLARLEGIGVNSKSGSLSGSGALVMLEKCGGRFDVKIFISKPIRGRKFKGNESIRPALDSRGSAQRTKNTPLPWRAIVRMRTNVFTNFPLEKISEKVR